MKISAAVQNGGGQHHVTVQTNANVQNLTIPPKSSGSGSGVNGGEFLFLALATCFCNDLYREAAKRGIVVENVQVQVDGEFGAEGEPARNVSYRAQVTAHAGDKEIEELMRMTDQVAEIQNTLRVVTPVTLAGMEVVAA